MTTRYRQSLARGEENLLARTAKERVKIDYFLAKGTHEEKLRTVLGRTYYSERTKAAVLEKTVEEWVEDVITCCERAFSEDGRTAIRGGKQKAKTRAARKARAA
jgi:hypothetical protein